MKRPVMTRNRMIDILPIRLLEASMTTSYARNASEGQYLCTVKKDGVNAGHYYITLDEVPGRAPTVLANAFHASAKLFTVVTSYASGVIQIRCYADDGTATAPTQLHVLVCSSDLSTEA